MPCFKPLHAWLPPGGGRPVFRFVMRDLSSRYELITLPCGRCIGCRLERSRKWAMRCVMEASLHDANSFITLTYDNDHVPSDMSLRPKDLQDFFKRLRKRIGVPIRYFACGEYGEHTQRPHYHAIIFGYQFEDRELWNPMMSELRMSRASKKSRLSLSTGALLSANLKDVCASSEGVWRSCYSSSLLQDLWSFGFTSVGDMTFESAAYVARYCLKKVTGDAAEAHYNGRVPEFVRMSNRPGIAAGWFAKFGTDVYPADKCFARGHPCKPPRYFDKLFQLQFPEEYDKLKAYRRQMANAIPEIEKSPDRLDVRQECLERRLSAQTHRGL